MKFENIGNGVEIIDCADKCFFTGEQVSFGVIRESEGDGRVFCPNNSVVLNVKQVGEVMARLENNSEGMMMKNIWDAVNWLKGEASDYGSYTPDGEVGLILLCKSTCSLSNAGDYHEGCTGFSDDIYQKVCTIEQFNECVAEMSDWLPTGWKLEDYAPNIKTEEEIQAMAKPVFTQAMADAGEPIKSGQQFKREGFDVGTNKVFYVGVHPLNNLLHVVWEVTNLDQFVGSYALPIECIKPLPTERDKSIAACMAVGELRARDGAGLVYGRLYDAGLLKLDANP